MRLSPRLWRQASGLYLPPLPTITELLKIYQIRAAKKLSQNFLLDQNVAKRLVKKSGPLRDCFVLEVGPGPGCLTRTILNENPRRLVLVEKDRRMLPILRDLKTAFDEMDARNRRLGLEEEAVVGSGSSSSAKSRTDDDESGDGGENDRVQIIRDDILSRRLEGIFPLEAVMPWESPERPRINVIGNLPFAISTPLLIKWLEDMSKRRGIFTYGRVGFTLTFQKEVADRMLASNTHSQRCRLSVMCQLYAHVRMCFVIPGRVFVPPPDVDVAVVTLHPKVENDVPEVDFRMVEKLVRNLFQFRQKMIVHCLERLFPPQLCQILAQRLIESTGLRYDNRPYFVSNEEIRRLCLAYQEICEEIPDIYHYKHDEPAHLRVPKEEAILARFKELNEDFDERFAAVDSTTTTTAEGSGEEVVDDDGIDASGGGGVRDDVRI